jgi:5-formyltetrahydrofolate cyclo-ligase
MTPDDDLPRRKTAMRREVAVRLESLDPAELAERGRRATRRLEETEDFRSAESLLLYAPMPDEIDVNALIDGRLAAGKAVFLPRCEAAAGRMHAARIFDRDRDTARGRFGITEP